MFCLLVSFPTGTVSWLVGVQIKVMLEQPLTCDSSFMLPTSTPHPRSPTQSLILKLDGTHMWTAANYKIMCKLNQLMDHNVIIKKSGSEKGE